MELCGEWDAWRDIQPPGPTTLHIKGTCCFPTAGWAVEVKRHEPQGINPYILMLDVVASQGGSVAPQVLTEVAVTWSEVTDFPYEQVQILAEDTEGKVLDIHDVV